MKIHTIPGQAMIMTNKDMFYGYLAKHTSVLHHFKFFTYQTSGL